MEKFILSIKAAPACGQKSWPAVLSADMNCLNNLSGVDSVREWMAELEKTATKPKNPDEGFTAKHLSLL